MLADDVRPLDRFLARLLSRSALSRQERDAILALPTSLSSQKAGTTFVSAGDNVEGAWIVDTGLVAGFKQQRNGSRQITALHIGGDMADLPSLLLSRAVTGLEALTDVSLLHIPMSALRSLRLGSARITEALWLDSSVDAAIQVEWAANVGRKSARSRLAHFLCEMAARYEHTGTCVGFSFELPMTQEHIADTMAITSIHVNRTLMGLKADGIVEMRSKTVYVLDWPALIKLGEFDPTYLHIYGAKEDLM